MTKAAKQAKDKLTANPLYFLGKGLDCICAQCGGSGKKAAFYMVWNETLTCSKCKIRY
jgi:hypothetical protein